MTKLIIMCLGVVLIIGCTSLNSTNRTTQNKPIVSQEISETDYSGLALYESLPKICIALGEMDSMTYIKGLALKEAYINYLSDNQTVNKRTLLGYTEARKADMMAGLDMDKNNQAYLQSMNKFCGQMQSLVKNEYGKLKQSQQPSLKPIYPDYLDYIVNGDGQ